MLRHFVLLFILIFFSLHLAKDITQDILRLGTPLDYLGNVQEDLSIFPSIVKQSFTIFGFISLALELAVIICVILFFTHPSKYFRLLRPILVVPGILLFYFLIAVLLDPRFNS